MVRLGHISRKENLVVEKSEVFEFLDDLKETGVTNMMGAEEYVMETYELPRMKARAFVVEWMTNYGKDDQ